MKEPLPILSFDAFNDLLNIGFKGLIISRAPLEEYKTAIKESPDFFWLSEKGGENALYPKLSEIEHKIEKLGKHNVVLIDRLDYLIFKNGFKKTCSFVNGLRELTYLSGTIVIISIDPSTLKKQQIRLLEKESKEVVFRHGTIANAEFEVLKSIYKQNNRGIKPYYNDIGKMIGISKPTLRKRIRNLVSTGHVRETIKGRKKTVQLTERGLHLFLR